MISNRKRTARTAISEADPADPRNNSGVMRKRLEERTARSGDTPPATSPEELAAMSLDELHEYSRTLWQSALPPVPEAPGVQTTRTISDLLDG